MSITYRTVLAATTVSVLLAGLTACGGDEPETPRPEPAEHTTEAEAEAEVDAGAEAEAEVDAEESEPDGFDECDLLTPEEVAAAEPVDHPLLVTSRGARALGDRGGWAMTCGYGNGETPGLYTSEVEILTRVDPELFGEDSLRPTPAALEDVTEIDGLGDRAYSAVTTVPWDTETEGPFGVQVDALRDDVIVSLRVRNRRGEAPDIDGTVALARTVLERLPDTIVVEPVLVTGRCADIDVDLAGAALGEPLIGLRGLTYDSGESVCNFHGTNAGMNITTSSGHDELIPTAPDPREVDGIGDQAYVGVPPLTFAQVLVGDREIAISGGGPGATAEPRDPTDDELAFLADVAGALG